jgi:hypothetical protein
MHLLPNALHLTLEARYLHYSGYHFEVGNSALLPPIEHAYAF